MSNLVSVIIPAYNVEDYIGTSLQSMLDQAYSHQEILVIDDASTDNTLRVIQQFRDNRIHIIRNETNLGLATSINKAIQLAKGVYIARMDADDVANPQRLQKQVAFLNEHPDVSIVGSAMQSFGHNKYVHKFPETHMACKAQLLFNVCFGHPTVLVRKAVFNDVQNLYRDELQQYSEEYDLWCRLVDKVSFANLSDVLLAYRTLDPAVKGEAEQKRRINSFAIRKDFIIKQWGEQKEMDYQFHDNICNLKKAADINELDTWLNWLIRCIQINQIKKSFASEALKYEFSKRCFELRYWNRQLGVKNILDWYSKSNPLKGYRPSIMQNLKFILRCIVNM